MAIVTTVNETQFIDTLLSDDYASWTHEDAKALYEYYEDLSEDIGEDIHLDRVAFRCKWTRADSIDEVVEDCDVIEDLEDLQLRTNVIEHENGVLLYQAIKY